LLQGIGSVATWNFASWSISCEAVTYVVFAVAVIYGINRSASFNVIALPAAALAYVMILTVEGTIDSIGFGLLRCFAGLAVGVFLSNFCGNGRETADRKIAAASLIVVGVLLISLFSPYQFWEVTTLPCFAVAILLLSRDVGPVAAVLNS